MPVAGGPLTGRRPPQMKGARPRLTFAAVVGQWPRSWWRLRSPPTAVGRALPAPRGTVAHRLSSQRGGGDPCPGRILDRMDYEYAPLRLPSNVDRLTAAAQLAIQAEFSD